MVLYLEVSASFIAFADCLIFPHSTKTTYRFLTFFKNYIDFEKELQNQQVHVSDNQATCNLHPTSPLLEKIK